MSKYLEQSVDEFRIYVANCSYDELEFIDKFLDTKLVGYPADSVEVKDAFEAATIEPTVSKRRDRNP